MIPLFRGSRFKALYKGVRHVAVFLLPVSLIAISVFSVSCSDEPDDSPSNTQSSGSPTAGASVVPGTTSSAKSAAGILQASPNPVPAGQNAGTTKISWKTKGDVTPVEVYVVQDAQPEVKFAQGAEGAIDAPWIVAGSTYEFRLYEGSGAARKMIDKIQVTRTP